MAKIRVTARLRVGLVMLALQAAPGLAHAETANACTPNGCGPGGFFGAAVPNELAGCSFKAACDAHDVCYSKCLSCHPFSKSPTCQGADNKAARRLECDGDFKKALVRASGSSKVCLAAADAYHFSVRKFGDSYHRGNKSKLSEADQFKAIFDAEYARVKAAQ
jgi:hypothetical protein